ncbi:MAG: hypothetical protein ABI129_07660 [Rhodanobacter sp.]
MSEGNAVKRPSGYAVSSKIAAKFQSLMRGFVDYFDAIEVASWIGSGRVCHARMKLRIAKIQ